jgi:hypothetical protein
MPSKKRRPYEKAPPSVDVVGPFFCHAVAALPDDALAADALPLPMDLVALTGEGRFQAVTRHGGLRTRYRSYGIYDDAIRAALSLFLYLNLPSAWRQSDMVRNGGSAELHRWLLSTRDRELSKIQFRHLVAKQNRVSQSKAADLVEGQPKAEAIAPIDFALDTQSPEPSRRESVLQDRMLPLGMEWSSPILMNKCQ